MEGWITLHRRFLGWEWFEKAEMVQLFVYLLLSANHNDKKWQGVDVKRGQVLTTYAKLGKITGLSPRSVRTCVERLKSTGEITTETTNHYTIVTICNYDKYQGGENTSDTPNDKQLTNDRQTTDKRPTSNINNNDNKDNKDNNLSLCSACARESEERERDEIFKIFFFKNFVAPAKEVERFYQHYGAQGWVRSTGQRIVDRVAAAKSWEQGEREKKRFPIQFVEALREIAEVLTPEQTTTMCRGIVFVEVDATRFQVNCADQATGEIIAHYSAHIQQRVAREVHIGVRRAN